MSKSRYFDIKELVCPDVYSKYSQRAWMFIDPKLIETLNIIREKILPTPITINTWSSGGTFTQRGLRCNRCQLVSTKTTPYLSAHIQGKAVDFDAKGLTAEEARNKIAAAQNLLPHPIRIERGVNWVHIDVYDTGASDKITYFNG